MEVDVDAPAARKRWTGLRPESVHPSGMNGLRPRPCTRLRPRPRRRRSTKSGAAGSRPRPQAVHVHLHLTSTSTSPSGSSFSRQLIPNPDRCAPMQPGTQGKRGGRLDPKLDIVFWMLFGAEQNRHLLLSLLNAVLQPPTPIEWAEVQHAEPERLGVDDKSIALDVASTAGRWRASRCRDAKPASSRAARAGALLLGSPVRRAATTRVAYTDLRRCAVIWITNFNELPEQRFHSIFRPPRGP